ncbi:MAG: hypothetical protein Q4A71_04990 [Actinomycetaceae bacterium]|nr:hypothetical protein [Actinomycetaceae bacterium]
MNNTKLLPPVANPGVIQKIVRKLGILAAVGAASAICVGLPGSAHADNATADNYEGAHHSQLVIPSWQAVGRVAEADLGGYLVGNEIAICTSDQEWAYSQKAHNLKFPVQRLVVKAYPTPPSFSPTTNKYVLESAKIPPFAYILQQKVPEAVQAARTGNPTALSAAVYALHSLTNRGVISIQSKNVTAAERALAGQMLREAAENAGPYRMETEVRSGTNGTADVHIAVYSASGKTQNVKATVAVSGAELATPSAATNTTGENSADAARLRVAQDQHGGPKTDAATTQSNIGQTPATQSPKVTHTFATSLPATIPLKSSATSKFHMKITVNSLPATTFRTWEVKGAQDMALAGKPSVLGGTVEGTITVPPSSPSKMPSTPPAPPLPPAPPAVTPPPVPPVLPVPPAPKPPAHIPSTPQTPPPAQPVAVEKPQPLPKPKPQPAPVKKSELALTGSTVKSGIGLATLLIGAGMFLRSRKLSIN